MTSAVPSTPSTSTKYSVTVGTLTGGTISPSPASCAQGEVVTLYIYPDANKKLDTLTVKDANGNKLTVTDKKFTMPASNVTVEATFIDGSAVEYTVTIGSTTNGSVVVKDNNTKFNKDDDVELIITPAAGYELDKLTYQKGSATAVDIDKSSKMFDMPEGDVTVSATFKKVDYTVTIDSAITGGSATANPSTCNFGDSVTLTITADSDKEIDKITVKDAAGNDVTVTDNKFSMPPSNVTVTVTFKAKSTT